jgi:hypothetical protein
MLTLCLLDESNDMEAYARAENIRWAWREWVLESCVERNGGHAWELELEHPDDGAGIQLGCAHCPAGVDDLFPDGHDLISVDLNGIVVEYGRHDSPEPLVVPVSAEVWTSRSFSLDYGYDYDAGIELTQTGPARAVEA